MADEETSEYILDQSRFWVQRILVPCLVCVGVVGNTMAVMVLTRRRMRSSTNIYLSALAIADIIHLLFVLLLSFKHYSNIHDRKYELYWRFFGLTHWLCDAASSTSVWLTVSFTIERYVAVCHPIRGKVFCTENRAKSVITIVYIFCLLTTASTTFEYQLTLEESCLRECSPGEMLAMQPAKQETPMQLQQKGNNHNFSSYNHFLRTQLQDILKNCSSTNNLHVIYVPVLSLNETMLQDDGPAKRDVSNPSKTNSSCCLTKYTIDTEYTNLGLNESYTTFMYWYSAIFFGLLPLVLIATFNCFLIHAVYVSQKRRKLMTNSQENISLSNENRITLMLIAVIILFIICQTPTASLLIYNNFNNSSTPRTRNIILILGNIFNFLMIVNASCNFLLYCVLSKKFRGTFKKLFCERARKKKPQESMSQSRSNSQRFSPTKQALLQRNASEYQTPRNLETMSLTSIPRSKSLITRPLGRNRSQDLNV